MSLSETGDASKLRVRKHPVLGDLPGAEQIHITVDGRALKARVGEAIAAALLANGIRVFRTTSHSGEPRGPFCGVGRCPDCMMIVDGKQNVRTCITPVRAGMRIETQHGLSTGKGDDS